MRINIVCDEADNGWIYSRFTDQIKKHSRHTILVNEKDPNKYDAIYFIPYYIFFNTNKPSTCWLSHQEQSEPLRSRFVSVAKSVDVGISHSIKYAKLLRDKHQCLNVVSAIPGVDADVFSLRSQNRPTNNKKMIVVYSGRAYTSSTRKNPKLLKRISKLPFVDFRATSGKLDFNDLPKFFHKADVCVQPSTIEGGSMAIQESLSCGLPIISMKGVGVTDEFGLGIIKANDNEDFIAKLKDLYLSKKYLTYWRRSDVMNKMRDQVKDQNWARWVQAHDDIWDQL